MPGEVYLGFSGVGGVMTGGIADYVLIRQQPTALPEASDPRLAVLESALSGRGFAVQRVTDMDGWLAYHAAFIACVAAALYRCGTDPVRLAASRCDISGAAAGSPALTCRDSRAWSLQAGGRRPGSGPAPEQAQPARAAAAPHKAARLWLACCRI